MFDRPSLTDLVNRTLADTLSRLPVGDLLRRSDPAVLARVMAGAAHELYGYLDYLSRQILPDTSESDWLDRHASIWLTEGRKPAAAAVGGVILSGVDGSVILAGTRLATAGGAQYETTADGTISAGTATASVVAIAAGAAGNAVAGTPLVLVSPVPGVQSAALVATGGLAGGADVETDDALRARVIARIQQPPHGGADFDYVVWALEVPGVTRAWCYPGELGPGTVTIRFVRDNDANLIPDAGEVAAVQVYIDALRPVTAQVTVVAPLPVPLDFTISGLVPATAAVRAAVESELRDLVVREAAPGGTLLISHVREAISIAAGEYDHELTSPAADVAHGAGEMAVFGVITWT